MVKNENFLSQDINLIKELESLKLKQKLLIDSLKRNSKTQENQLFLDLNSKLDFLVKIFKEANTQNEEEEKESIEKENQAKLDSMLEKIENLSKSIDEKFDKMNEKTENLSVKIKNNTENKPNSNLNNNPSSQNTENKEETNNNTEKTENKTNSDSTIPPKPDFESKIENFANKPQNTTENNNNNTEDNKKEETTDTEKKEKKKKWF